MTGRCRSGLERRAAEAVQSGRVVDAAEVELARVLADQIDSLDEQLGGDDAKPFDRQPLVGLAKAYAESLGRLFAVEDGADDPFADLVARVTADADREP